MIVRLMPRPNVRRAEHRRGPIIARALVNRRLAVVLTVARAQRIAAKVRRVPGDVVAVFVIEDTAIVGSVCPVTPTCGLHQCPLCQ